MLCKDSCDMQHHWGQNGSRCQVLPSDKETPMQLIPVLFQCTGQCGANAVSALDIGWRILQNIPECMFAQEPLRGFFNADFS